MNEARDETVRELLRSTHRRPPDSASPNTTRRAAPVCHLGDSNEHEDADLVLRAREGDGWAQELLFRRHAAMVTGFCVRMLGDRDQAADVAQETFALALEKLDSLREPAAFKGWLVRIAVSQMHRIYRRERFVRLFRRADGPTPLAQLASKAASPDVKAELELVDRALAGLPSEQRLAWMLRHVEGLELQEVADACGCSLATAKRRVAAAHARVRRHARVED